MKIDRALAERLSSLPWVGKVVYQTLETFRGDEVEVSTYLTVEPKNVNTRDEYLTTTALIQRDIPEVEKWNKKFTGHHLDLEYHNEDDNSYLSVEFWNLSDEDYGAIIGCNLVKKKTSYSTLVCEVKQ